MRVFIRPTQDASIYERYETRNTGRDEIIEVGKDYEGEYIIRGLMKFALSDLQDIPATASYDLRLFAANATRLKTTQKIEIWTASGSFDEGTGYFYQNIYQKLDGVNWEESGSIPMAPSASVTLDFTAKNPDITVDITSLVREAISGSRDLDIMLKFPDADEMDDENEGNVKFFSSNTHTIYHPQLVAKWNDQVYSTGSMAALSGYQISVVPTTLKSHYRVGETVMARLSAREKYPTKTFATASRYDGDNYLPRDSYFSLIDEQSGITLIPFDDASRISVGNGINFVTFPVSENTMHPLRHYKLLFKVVRNGVDEVIDPKAIFMVTQ